MSLYSKRNICRTVLFSLAFFLSASSCAWRGGGGGGYHEGGYGGGGYSYHGGGYSYHNGGYYGGGWGAGSTVVIGAPGYYYPSQCQTVTVCSSPANCWLQQSCD